MTEVGGESNKKVVNYSNMYNTYEYTKSVFTTYDYNKVHEKTITPLPRHKRNKRKNKASKNARTSDALL